jgi:hypothetical protein
MSPNPEMSSAMLTKQVVQDDHSPEEGLHPKLNEGRAYPFVWTPLSKEEKMKRREVYFANGPWCVSPKASMLDLVRSSPGNVLMPRQFTAIAEKIYNFKLRPDDVFVVTYPKCGTTWTQEMVWQILHNMDVEGGKENIMTRSPFLEMQSLTDSNVSNVNLDKRAIAALELADAMASPRVIKTHLPIDMLPPNLLDTCKVVFVARNPMDCAVSFYHHEQLVPQQGFAGSFDQYAELFRRGNNPMGEYFYNLKSGWSRRHHPNLKFIWFEDMKKDISSIIVQMTQFLGYNMIPKKMGQLEAHLHIDNFRKNESVNMKTNYEKGTFIRKGSVGGWRGYFEDEQIASWKTWIEEETRGTGLDFRMD